MTPILFIPGLLCSGELFAAQAAALWRLGPTTVASTLEGRTITEVAKAILAAAPPRFALAGLSMGGYICFEIMRLAPDRVERLALLDTSARPDTAAQTAARRAALARARETAFLPVALENLTSLLHPARRQDEDLHALCKRMALAVGLEGFERQLEIAISRPDSMPDLPRIAAPTLVLVGDTDMLTPVDRAREIASAIPGARLAIIEQCGHLSAIERPRAVSDALIDWMAWR